MYKSVFIELESQDWIINILGKDLCEGLNRQGYTCRIGKYDEYRDEDISFHMWWLLTQPHYKAKVNAIFITHTDDKYKEERLVKIKNEYDFYFCMSPEDAQYLIELGYDRKKVYGINLPIRNTFIRPITMAVAVAKYFGMDRKDILKGVADITPLHGRMSPARGLHGSIIIDDSSYISVDAVHNGIKTIEQLESSAKMVITDNAQKVNTLDMGLLTDVVILGEKPKGEPEHPKVHYFDNELDLIHYVGTRLEPDGIVLLEIPLPEIIQSYLW